MNLKQINEILRNQAHLTKVQGIIYKGEVATDDYYEEKGQGTTGSRCQLYAIDSEPTILIKVEWSSDSYGDEGAYPHRLQFVKEEDINITDYK